MEKLKQNSDIMAQDKFKLYEILLGCVRHNHERWIDNFKILLTFNGFLLSAVTLSFVYGFGQNKPIFSIPIILLCVIGARVTCKGLGFIKRIQIDTDLRVNQVVRVENEIPGITIRPYQEGKRFFFENKDLPDLEQKKYRYKGIRGISTYESICKSIIFYYISLVIIIFITLIFKFNLLKLLKQFELFVLNL